MAKKLQVVGVPEEQWLKIRESFLNSSHRGDQGGNGNGESGEAVGAEEEPIIAEAKKLFGEELIEIKE